MDDQHTDSESHEEREAQTLVDRIEKKQASQEAAKVEETKAGIRAVLTPDQQVKFDDFLKRLDEQRKKDAASH